MKLFLLSLVGVFVGVSSSAQIFPEQYRPCSWSRTLNLTSEKVGVWVNTANENERLVIEADGIKELPLSSFVRKDAVSDNMCISRSAKSKKVKHVFYHISHGQRQLRELILRFKEDGSLVASGTDCAIRRYNNFSHGFSPAIRKPSSGQSYSVITCLESALNIYRKL